MLNHTKNTNLLSSTKTVRAFLMALSTVLPWGLGILLGNAQYGSIAAFGTYLLLVSFPHLPLKHKGRILISSACIFGIFATIGVNITLGSWFFFLSALLAAFAQCLGELKEGYLRLPLALAALAFFLSVGQIPAGGPTSYSIYFSIGLFWGVIIAFICIPTTQDITQTHSFNLLKDKNQKRFAFSMILASLLGSIAACISPGSHPCWLTAAGLRVMKPTREQTIYRMKARGFGTLLGAAVGGLLLGLSPLPWLHVLLVGALIFAMLLIGAKRYAGWSFCLTAIALAFNLLPEGDPLMMASNRVMLTLGGIFIALMMLIFLPANLKPLENTKKNG